MPDPARILIVEDEAGILRFLRSSLDGSGYSIMPARTAAEALQQLDSFQPELMILDLGLPDMDGLLLIDAVRRSSQLPIIILSARDRERDKVDALDRGADDYLTKPFGIEELKARIRVALRLRARSLLPDEGAGSVFRCGELCVDLQKRSVSLGGELVHLTPTEFRLLELLVSHAGRVLTHRMLLIEVWGPVYAEEVHQLRVHMANLRRKLEAQPAQPRYIQTELGVGYRFAEATE